MVNEYSKKHTGIVEKIFISRKKGMPREQIREGKFIEGFGLVGDVNSGKPDKNVAILGLEGREQIEKYGKEGLCVNRFHETIRTKNIELYRLPVGTKIKIGETIHEIRSTGKNCFDECQIVKKESRCLLSRQVLFTKVISGGIIRVGDLIQLL